MKLEGFEAYVERAGSLIEKSGIATGDIVQSDMFCYDVPTNERYDDVKRSLGGAAVLISETMVNGRLIAVYEFDEPIVAAGRVFSYVELPQPKTQEEVEGIDHLQFVTRQGLSRFQEKYADLPFVTKGSEQNRLLQLQDDYVKVRFHDKHIGAVVELENSSNYAQNVGIFTAKTI